MEYILEDGRRKLYNKKSLSKQGSRGQNINFFLQIPAKFNQNRLINVDFRILRYIGSWLKIPANFNQNRLINIDFRMSRYIGA